MEKLIRSFGFALKGLKSVWIEEFNFKVEISIGIIAVIFGFISNFSSTRWLFLIITIALVILGEIVNTVVEDICNKIEPNHNPVIGRIKDMMAGYVLISSITAIIIGLFLFLS